MNRLSTQINSMFIFGYKGTNPPQKLKSLIEQDLGGIIFFAENIIERNDFKKTVKALSALQSNLILSIDQEGGRVQRTSNLKDKIDYISPLHLTNKPTKAIQKHYEILTHELLDFGINTNFAPVLDVFTNPNDPIINKRAFGRTSKDVIKFAEIQNSTLQQSGIKTTGKHFPGHGPADVDSHINMPKIELTLEEMKEHLTPFRKIRTDAMMIAHVHYTAFDKETVPASLSKNAINYLKNDIAFKGIIISDDMVMGGITKHYEPAEACTKGIMAGIEMFIFREYNIEILSKLEKEAQQNPALRQKIEQASKKITQFKSTIKLRNHSEFSSDIAIKEIENIKNTPDVQ